MPLTTERLRNDSLGFTFNETRAFSEGGRAASHKSKVEFTLRSRHQIKGTFANIGLVALKQAHKQRKMLHWITA